MKAPSTPRELPPVGNHPATLYKIIYIGTVKTDYKGEVKNVYKVSLTWELNNKLKVWKEGEEAKPISVSQMYSFSMGDKSNLKPIVEGIIGGLSPSQAVDFDLDTLLGKASLLQINHGVSETGNPKQILTTSQFPDGMQAPKPFNKQILLSFENWNEEVFNALPDWMKNDIQSTPEYKFMKNGGEKTVIQGDGYHGVADVSTGEVDPSDIPF